jgi:DNA-directed RNA polymerase subunit RPC12/RpoP
MQRWRNACTECTASFVIAYDAADEPTDLLPVACPGCGATLFVVAPVGVSHAVRILPEQTVAQCCNGCGRNFDVVFYGEPHEPASRVPVACPDCGWVNYGNVATSALSDASEIPRYEARRRQARRGRGRTA